MTWDARLPAPWPRSVLPGLNSMNAASTDYLLFSVSLPTSAGNTFQRLSAPLSITFSGRSATPPLSDPS